jgi:hypothetical protein
MARLRRAEDFFSAAQSLRRWNCDLLAYLATLAVNPSFSLNDLCG